jgi:class 3 adenylate cyclase
MTLEVRGSFDAVLAFADVVDSSKFSAVLEYEDYASRVLEFQQCFRAIGERYFAQPADRTVGFTRVEARGDEGTVFVVDDSVPAAELVLRAVEFLIHLKGYLKLTGISANGAKAPSQIGVGAGVHFGRVAYAVDSGSPHSDITRIEGFEINYAKRIESSSRSGQCSKIMLSRKAYSLLEGAPLIFDRMVVPLKGIDDCAEVYELRSGLFNLRLAPGDDPREEELVTVTCQLAADANSIDERWLKCLAISVLDGLIQKYPVPERQAEWGDLQQKLAWHSCIEDDPILLFLRARILGGRKEYSQQLRYLREVLQKCPNFIHARKAMINACSARDIAKEFLEWFPDLLNDAEKKEFGQVIDLLRSPVKK